MSFSKKYGKAIDFLMEKGNVAVRYRTLIDLCDSPNEPELDQIRQEIAGLVWQYN